MKLSQLASKPQLIKLSIDDADTIKEFGEALEFYVYDRQDIDTYMSLAALDKDNQGQIIELIYGMIYDENGELIVKDGVSLPVNILSKVIPLVVENLGNLKSQTTDK